MPVFEIFTELTYLVDAYFNDRPFSLFSLPAFSFLFLTQKNDFN